MTSLAQSFSVGPSVREIHLVMGSDEPSEAIINVNFK